MTEIKICGITNRKDAFAAVESGVDALGFIFYKKSPRYVSPEKVKEFIEGLPHTVTKVGVFVNHDASEVKTIFDFCRLDLLQLHGNESPDYCSDFPASVLIKALSPKPGDDFELLSHYPVKAFLVDTYDSERYGGTGRTSNWELAAKLSAIHHLILSGGLMKDNIREAIATVSPLAVDVNSGVEVSPGKKDHHKIREIVDIIRRTDSRPDTNYTGIFTRE
ncbi:MAG: phosphoribosylanthranilate isomerase [Deltaproteobacteria bacterium]|nr:phosphoribosylanthranilate isomerase [Deltaproteobacteria bacterium]